ncbi:MAG: nucleotidyltransferase domain-containing protein [Candidatus Thermoplasmatota archaeon]|jgi:predicted nucleotidyltransferase|nr:nucleotidyltransferase domain-containing protein [Candidatus Thermoplasmatota archaeon]
MAELEEIINKAVGRIIALPGSENIEFIYLYGSVAHRKSHTGSDIDICICHGGTEQEAYKFLLNAISSIDSNILDIKLFRQLPLYIRIDVLKGRLLYSKDVSRVYDIAYDTIKEYDEFEPRFYDYIGKEAIH